MYPSDLKKYIPKLSRTAQSYLVMLRNLFPRGPIWNFTLPLINERIAPSWVELATYYQDSFEGRVKKQWWNVDFLEKNFIGKFGTLYGALCGDVGQTFNLLPATAVLTGKFILEYSVVMGEHYIINETMGFYLHQASDNALVCSIRNEFDGGIDETVYNSVWTDEDTDLSTHSTTVSWIPPSNTVIRLKIERDLNNLITAYYYDGSTWNSFGSGITNSADLYIVLHGSAYNGFANIKLQADSGLVLLKNQTVTSSSLGAMLAAFAEELEICELRVLDLMREAVPGLSHELLASWEADCGLPDECTPAEQTYFQRQQAVHAKIYGRIGNGMSEAFYINYAAMLGMTITIEDDAFGTPFRVSQKSTGVLQRVTQMPTTGIDGSRLSSTGSGNIVQITIASDPKGNTNYFKCIMEKIKPAHVKIVYA